MELCTCGPAIGGRTASATLTGPWLEGCRNQRGPRQRVVAWLGAMDERGRLGVKRCAEGRTTQQGSLFLEAQPEWVEVDVKRVHVERSRKFGGPWLGLELLRRLVRHHGRGLGAELRPGQQPDGARPLAAQQSLVNSLRSPGERAERRRNGGKAGPRPPSSTAAATSRTAPNGTRRRRLRRGVIRPAPASPSPARPRLDTRSPAGTS